MILAFAALWIAGFAWLVAVEREMDGPFEGDPLPGFAEPGRDRRSRPAGTGGGRNSPRRCQCL